jgi:hypothetical protein
MTTLLDGIQSKYSDSKDFVDFSSILTASV